MKKSVLIGAALAAVVATPALAQSIGPITGPEIITPPQRNLTINLDAEVSSICGVFTQSGTGVEIDFGDLATTRPTSEVNKVAAVTYRCNSAAGFSRSVSSLNNGVLKRVGSNGGLYNTISYDFTQEATSTSDVGLTKRTLTSAATSQHVQSAGNYLNGVTSNVVLNVRGVSSGPDRVTGSIGTTVFAGDYVDTITIAVTAR